MYFFMVFGMFVLCILCRSVCRFTVSNAFDMSSAMAMVLLGGLCLLRPEVMMLLMDWSAVVVE